MSKARNEFYTQFMEENSEDQGKLFSAAKELLAVENKLSFPDHLDENKLANKAAKFFCDKGWWNSKWNRFDENTRDWDTW